MAASAKHKGWLWRPNEGLLAAVNRGAKSGAVVVAANTALDGVLLGTPVSPALAVDSMVISNLVASGDILIATNNGGNSQACFWLDASANTLKLYTAGVEAIGISAAQVVTLASGISTGDFKLGLTLTAGADGVGAATEQLTSGGAAAECTWAGAGCLREFKHIMGERRDASQVLAQILGTPVYDFKYKRRHESGKRITSTGDFETVYTGIMADDAPWATHGGGRVLNPINTFGYTVLAIQALQAQIDELKSGRAN